MAEQKTKLDRRFYLNPFTRFDVFSSRVVVMHYMGEEVKRRKLEATSNLQIMRAFVSELGPLATGVPIPVPVVPIPSEMELGGETVTPKSEVLKDMERRLSKVEKQLRRFRRK